MTRILLAWEMGLNRGHRDPLHALGSVFRSRDHQVVYCFKEPSRPGEAPHPDAPELLAPQVHVRQVRSRHSRTALNYTDQLIRCGYLDSAALSQAVDAWREIYRAQRAEFVVADHSPTALLAARAEQLPSAVTGNGFLIPPNTDPLPPCAWWKAPPKRARLRWREQDVLRTLNTVLAQQGGPPLDRVGDLLASPVRALLTVPGLDDYPKRPADETYYGLLTHPGGGHWPGWPDGEGPKVLGYLRASQPDLPALLDALEQVPVRALIFVPDGSEAQYARYANGPVQITRTPLDLRRGGEACDFGVCYGSYGFLAEMATHGKPVLTAPSIMHHAMTSMRLVSAGTAVPGGPKVDTDGYVRRLRTLIDDTRYAERAQRLKEAIAEYPNGQAVLERVVDECEAHF